jgi:transposase-like protein
MSYVLLKTFGNYIEANIAMSMLADEGINCHIEDESSVTLMYMASGFRLMVYDTQAERAAEIIKNTEAAYLKTISCPICHQSGFEIKYITESHEDAVRKLPLGRMIALMSKLFTKEGTTMQVKHYVCENCGKEFDELPV